MKLFSLKNNSKSLNRIGLILGMLGVIILFLWGPPQPKFEKGIGIMVEDTTVINGKSAGEHDLTIEKRIKKHRLLSSLGLIFIFLGFAGQLGATCMKDENIKLVKGQVLKENE
ncbi:MAG: hypothetical protein JEY96_16690 [Bacteroidales bacterium]|nr:hypothetical protein [Bacteroidales bacterium]